MERQCQDKTTSRRTEMEAKEERTIRTRRRTERERYDRRTEKKTPKEDENKEKK